MGPHSSADSSAHGSSTSTKLVDMALYKLKAALFTPARTLIGAASSQQLPASPPKEEQEQDVRLCLDSEESSRSRKRKRVVPKAPTDVGKEKRILQPRLLQRNSILQSALQECESDSQVITPYNRIALVPSIADLDVCRTVPVSVHHISDEIKIPQFRKLSSAEMVGGRLRKLLNVEDTSYVIYEKRHRKHELLEKRSKNRERERLAHDRLKLMDEIEQLKTIDGHHLMRIAALRGSTLESDNEAAEQLRQRLLREAEKMMELYDALGLGDKKKEKMVSSAQHISEPPNSDPKENGTYSKGKRKRKDSQVEQFDEPSLKRGRGRPRKSSVDSNTNGKAPERHRNMKSSPKYSKSIKNPRAFGHPLPPIPHQEFVLPEDDFKAAMADRIRDKS